MESGALDVANKEIDALQEMEPPKTKVQLRSFLGMCNVYRKLVKEFPTMAAQLNKLLKKTASESIETLTDEQQTSFDTLKQRLLAPPVLALPRADLPYVLDKNVNAEQIGCVLYTIHTAKDLRHIG